MEFRVWGFACRAHGLKGGITCGSAIMAGDMREGSKEERKRICEGVGEGGDEDQGSTKRRKKRVRAYGRTLLQMEEEELKSLREM